MGPPIRRRQGHWPRPRDRNGRVSRRAGGDNHVPAGRGQDAHPDLARPRSCLCYCCCSTHFDPDPDLGWNNNTIRAPRQESDFNHQHPARPTSLHKQHSTPQTAHTRHRYNRATHLNRRAIDIAAASARDRNAAEHRVRIPGPESDIQVRGPKGVVPRRGAPGGVDVDPERHDAGRVPECSEMVGSEIRC